MADEQVVEQTQDTSTTTDPAKPETQTTDPAKPQSTQRPDPAQAKGGDDADKRFRGIQADLARERKSRQEFERKSQEFETRLAAETRRVQALAGVTPVGADEAEAAEIRARFGKVFSREQLLEQLGMTPDEIEEMRESLKERKSLQATTDHYWKTHGQAMVSSVVKDVEASYGDLNDKQKQALTKAYVLRLQADPEALDRHENGDQTFVKEFAKEWLDDWFEPARRKVTAAEVNQFRRVPNGKDRNLVQSGEKQINVNNNDEVMDLLVKGRTFTGRNQR